MCLQSSTQELGTFTSGGAEMFMPDGMGCIPPVVSPTLGGSKFVYTSGGSCGRACNVPPLIGTSTCGAKIYHIEPDTARSPIVSAKRKGAKVTPRPQRNTEQMETA